MSLNSRIELARDYHARTAHSPRSVREGGHGLDWEVKPFPFKVYPDLPPQVLPRDLPALQRDTLGAIGGPPAAPVPLDLPGLAALLFFSAGVTRRRTYPGAGEVFFRAAASTGALYQTEVYVVTAGVEGLEPGVYHFSPGDFALRRLRGGDFRGALALAADDDDLGAVPATVVLSAIYWRNTWKYRARAYRHLFWDAGTMLANLLAVARALALPARLVAGFVDARVNGLLGLDPEREAALVLCPVGAPLTPAPPPPVVAPLRHQVIPLSAREVDEPLVRDAHAASSLETEAEVRAWRAAPAPAGERGAPEAPGPAPLLLPTPRSEAERGLGETILRRGSTRRFSGEAISALDLSTALHHATRPLAADWPSNLVDLYLMVHAVEGVPPGAYAYDPREHALLALRAGDLRSEAAFLCLEQPLGGLGSCTVFFLADLDRVLPRFGNRGYRLVNLEAGLAGGRLYLAAYGQGFGATGLTFYDQAVVEAFAPRARGLDAIFVTALGRSVRPAGAEALVAPPRSRRQA